MFEDLLSAGLPQQHVQSAAAHRLDGLPVEASRFPAQHMRKSAQSEQCLRAAFDFNVQNAAYSASELERLIVGPLPIERARMPTKPQSGLPASIKMLITSKIR